MRLDEASDTTCVNEGDEEGEAGVGKEVGRDTSAVHIVAVNVDDADALGAQLRRDAGGVVVRAAAQVMTISAAGERVVEAVLTVRAAAEMGRPGHPTSVLHNEQQPSPSGSTLHSSQMSISDRESGKSASYRVSSSYFWTGTVRLGRVTLRGRD